MKITIFVQTLGGGGIISESSLNLNFSINSISCAVVTGNWILLQTAKTIDYLVRNSFHKSIKLTHP